MTPPGSPSCQTLERNRGRCQLTPAMLCNETAAGANFSSGSAKWAALCEEKWRLRRGGRHWSGWGRDDMWQKGVKGAVGRKKRGLKEHGKSADHYNCLFSLWLRYSMSLLTKLPPEVLEQVSHIFRFNQLSQNISRYKTQNRSQSLIVLLPILWDG